MLVSSNVSLISLASRELAARPRSALSSPSRMACMRARETTMVSCGTLAIMTLTFTMTLSPAEIRCTDHDLDLHLDPHPDPH